MNRTKRHDWKMLQAEYDTGLTIRQLCQKFGLAGRSIVEATKRGDFKTRNQSEARKQSKCIRVVSEETKEKISIAARNRTSKNYLASKRFNHNGILLESSWEKKVAEDLDACSIKWTRPEALVYDDCGQKRRYYPDFYLPDYNIYLDPKNDYVRKLDQRKLSLVRVQHSIVLLILNKDQLTWKEIKNLWDTKGGS